MGVHIRLVNHHLHGRVRLGGWITSLHEHQTKTLHQLHLFPFIKSNLLDPAQVFWYCFSTHPYEITLKKKIFKELLKNRSPLTLITFAL